VRKPLNISDCVLLAVNFHDLSEQVAKVAAFMWIFDSERFA